MAGGATSGGTSSRFRGLLLAAMCLAPIGDAGAQAAGGLSPAERDIVKRITIGSIRDATQALADDRLAGRGTLQPGGEQAAAWIAGRMKKLGLAPGGGNGTYLQAVPLLATEFVAPTHVTVDGVPLEYGKDWSSLGAFADLQVRAPLVFVGHGLVSKQFGRDDLKDVDLRGKIVVVVDGRPPDETAERWAAITEDADMVPTLVARGIAGLINIPNGRGDLPRDFIIDQTARRAISEPSASPPQPIPLMFLSAAAGERLLAGSGRTAQETFDAADAADFRPWPLAATVEIQFASSRQAGTAPNVIGVLKGSDPALAAEAVVFSAHYDGFGVLRDAIYNGAADNALGVGEMLAVAEAFARAKVKPRRSLVFIAFTAEEYGLVGSRYYAAHPTWDLAKTAAVLNLDGIGTEIMGPMQGMIAYGAPFSSLGAMFLDVARGHGVTPMEDPIPSQGVFGRSDHFAFVEVGVPGLMLVGSPVVDGAQFAERFDAFERTKYHQPTDDVYRDWHWEGAREVAEMMAIIGHRVAQADGMPSFHAGTPYADHVRGQAPRP